MLFDLWYARACRQGKAIVIENSHVQRQFSGSTMCVVDPFPLHLNAAACRLDKLEFGYVLHSRLVLGVDVLGCPVGHQHVNSVHLVVVVRVPVRADTKRLRAVVVLIASREPDQCSEVVAHRLVPIDVCLHLPEEALKPIVGVVPVVQKCHTLVPHPHVAARVPIAPEVVDERCVSRGPS